MKHKKKMTNALALMLSLLMLLTVIPISVSADEAPEGATAINNAQDFAAMSADGYYYLADNITLSATYTSPFTGALDGNGKTITTSVPIFNEVAGGSIENLTIAGTKVTGMAVLANYVSGNAYFSDITNNVTTVDGSAAVVSETSPSDNTAGGIAGVIVKSVTEGITVVFENCVNNSKVTASGTGHAGGILGYARFHSNAGNANYINTVNIIFYNCVNNGAVTAKKPGGIMSYAEGTASVMIVNCHNTGKMTGTDCTGGIIAQVTRNAPGCYIIGCTNTADISGGITGGIMGIDSFGQDNAEYKIELNVKNAVSGCFNSGNITGTNMTGGIVGRWYGGSTEYCGNTGNINGTSQAGGIVGHDHGYVSYVRYCYNTGNILTTKYGGGITSMFNNAASEIYGCYNSGTVGYSTAPSDGYYTIGQILFGALGKTHDNYYNSEITYSTTNGTNATYAYYKKSGSAHEPTNSDAVAYTTADLTSGKLAYDINAVVGKTVFYQNLTGKTPDANPALDGSSVVIKVNDSYMSVALETADMAAARIDGENAGLRFSTSVSKADYDALIAAGVKADDITFGTMITPDDYLTAVHKVDGSFTMADFDLLLANVGTSYVNSTIKTKGTDGFYASDEDAYYFCGSVVQVKAENYGMDYSAVGYMKIGDTVIYSSAYATRNIADVAYEAYIDREDTADDVYTQLIAADNTHAIEETVTYSPYTEAQLIILKKFFE